MDLFAPLDSLKQCLENEAPPETAWRFFYQMTLEADIFAMSFDTKLPHLTEALELLIERCFHVEVTIREFLSLRIEDTSFYHGVCWVRGLIVTYFYFSDIDTGIVAIPNPPFSNNVDLHRFALSDDFNVVNLGDKLPQHLH